ncbi:MAG: MFS transporter [Clostridia bacterium]|nr:MFS transporter [Clostridia bacterium]
MKEESNKINKIVKLYPIFYALSADTIFFVPIDTLYLSLVKHLSASEISATTMISLLVCILSRNLIEKAARKIGNANSVKLGCLLLLISTIILTFGTSIVSIIAYKIILEYAYMFWIMSNIILRNNLTAMNRKDEYFSIRNKAKVMYGISTMITALISGYLFNINVYLPLYISIALYIVLLSMSFSFCEAKNVEEEKTKKPIKNIKLSSLVVLVILSNALFYGIIKLGQNNSKLFMQYDFSNVLSVENVTIMITTIVLISRVARIIGNIIFGKLYKKIKDKMSIILTIMELLAFSLLIIGHYIDFNFWLKVIIMATGFCLILAIRDSFQIYIEDVALKISGKEVHQKVMINIEVYRKVLQLIFSGIFTLILTKFDLSVVIIILCILSTMEILLNKKMYNRLVKLNS